MIYFYDINDIIHEKFVLLSKILEFIVMEKSWCLWELPYKTKLRDWEAVADFTMRMMPQRCCCKHFWINILIAFITPFMHKTKFQMLSACFYMKPISHGLRFSISEDSQRKCAAGFTGNFRTRLGRIVYSFI